jgi:hypothetical protein
MIWINPPTVNESFLWRKPLIGSIFSLICISGILAALFPKQCSQTFHFQKGNMNLSSHKVNTTSHHPDCGRFSAHTIRIGSHTLCAACTGLLLGALVALVGTASYFFSDANLEVGFTGVLIGAVGIVLGFLQLKFRGFIRLILNMFFVVGAFLILVGIDQLTESVFVDFFLVALVAFWILTRIQLSQWDHWKICSSCESQCEVWEAKRSGN